MISKMNYYYDEFIQLGTDYNNINEVLRYDERMSKVRNIDQETQEIKNLIRLKKDDIILEIGCGTSNLSIGLSKYCKEIYAIDISKIMLEYSIEKVKKANINNINFLHAGFLTNDFSENKFNSVITQLALHHLPDFWKLIALKKINKIIKPNGFLLLTDVVFPSDLQNYDEYFNSIIGNIEDDYIKEDVRRHIQNEYSTFDWAIEKMIIKSGFEINNKKKIEPFLISYLCKNLK